jgi:cytochrome c oxidase subunit IV
MENQTDITHTETKAHREAGLRTYLFVWITLVVLTGLTIAAASLNLGGIAIIVCLGIAAIKSTFVLLYFMHLRYEQRLLLKLLIPIVIITLAIFIGLTYSDIITR